MERSSNLLEHRPLRTILGFILASYLATIAVAQEPVPDQPGIEPNDAILTIRGIREAGLMYAGAAGVRDRRVSPIFGDWAGLPPILAFGGGSDILIATQC